MRSLLWASFLITLWVAQTEAQAQVNLTISGIVQDQSGAVFLGAEVDLLRSGTQQQTMATDASGSFRFDKVQPGNYEVRTRRAGFKTDTAKVTVGTRSPARLRIVLS